MNLMLLIAKSYVDDLTCVNKYRDEETGLTVAFVDAEGPVVNGHFVVSTETHDDDGLPHTLEHLIFFGGSEKYPYKGVLNLLANRCLASGTNCFTNVDLTYFTLNTVGSEGFLNILPVVLDHILYPTLSVSIFLCFSCLFRIFSRILRSQRKFTTSMEKEKMRVLCILK